MSAIAEPQTGAPAYSVEAIARACHEAARAIQIANGERDISPHWGAAPNCQRNSCMDGVRLALAGLGPEALHREWVTRRESLGWKYGPEKDEAKRTHPNLVKYGELPPEQQRKDVLFCAIVAALAPPEGLYQLWVKPDGRPHAKDGEPMGRQQASARAKRGNSDAMADNLSVTYSALPVGEHPTDAVRDAVPWSDVASGMDPFAIPANRIGGGA